MIALIVFCVVMAVIEEVNFAVPYFQEYISTGSITIEQANFSCLCRCFIVILNL